MVMRYELLKRGHDVKGFFIWDNKKSEIVSRHLKLSNAKDKLAKLISKQHFKKGKTKRRK